MDTEIEQAMRRALLLAARGPITGPNPQVGCVILSASGATLAEGWHRGAGTPHAEVDALSKLSAGEARGATAVVTLEPCNHVGHTGPCSEALISAGIARVYFALRDPNPVAAGGEARLRAAGVDVVGGVLADAVADAMREWLAATRTGSMAAAMCADSTRCLSTFWPYEVRYRSRPTRATSSGGRSGMPTSTVA